MENAIKTFNIYRWSPDDDENPRMDSYTIDLDDCGPMVLDALIKIKGEQDQTVTFRRSCREGICGSCSMNVDGTNTLACLKPIDEVKGDVTITPLPHMPVIKDLVPDLSHVYAQLQSIEPWLKLIRRHRKTRKDYKARSEREELDGMWECVCVLAVLPPARVIGGMVINILALRFYCKPIAGLRIAVMKALVNGLMRWKTRSGLYRCHTIMNCTKTCPKGLNPGKAIANIKKLQLERH